MLVLQYIFPFLMSCMTNILTSDLFLQSRCTETLSLWGTSLSGTIPSSLYELANLKALRLRNNEPGLHGTIQSEVGNLLRLKEFVLNDNPLLTGTVPSELGLCQELSKLLHANCCSLTMMLPPVPLFQNDFHFYRRNPATQYPTNWNYAN